MSFTWNHWQYGRHEVPEQYRWVVTILDLDRAPGQLRPAATRRSERFGYLYQPFRFVRFTDGLSPQWGVIFPTRRPGATHLIRAPRKLTVEQLRADINRTFANIADSEWAMYEEAGSILSWSQRPHQIWKTSVITREGRPV